jgi:hypothetical protein
VSSSLHQDGPNLCLRVPLAWYLTRAALLLLAADSPDEGADESGRAPACRRNRGGWGRVEAVGVGEHHAGYVLDSLLEIDQCQTRDRPRVEVAAAAASVHRLPERANQELFEAACQAIRLLQDRQQHHMPPEMIDGRERRVLKALRLALCGRP